MKIHMPFFLLVCALFTNDAIAQDAIPKPSKEDSTKFASIMAAVQEHVPQPPQTIQSPNMASLGTYGEIPVSLHTGKPEINVNLHTVSDGKISIPISLNYDASGVRPDVHPGWVGLNFNLSTNYAVIRTVKDAPDEGLEGVSTIQAGYLRPNVRIGLNYSAADWFSTTKLKGIASNSSSFDTEPDEYGFSAPGLSGKFYMGQDGLWKIQCERPVTVELLSATLIDAPFVPPHWTGNMWSTVGHYAPHVSGFRITDEYGTKYVFGGTNAFVEYSMDFFDQGKDTWLCNAWQLNSITTQTGQVVSFTYERKDFVAQMYFSVYNKSARVDGGSWFSCSNWSSLIGQNGAYSGKLISPVYLTEIAGTNFKVKFTSTISNELRYTQDIFDTYVNYMVTNNHSKLDFMSYLYTCFYPDATATSGCDFNTTLSTLLDRLQWRKLDKIEIRDGNANTIREFNLTYNNVNTERLMLLSVQEKSVGKLIPPYEFTYFSEGAFKLPGYGKSHTDHWGFNNGLLINVTSDFNAVGTYGTTFRSPATDARYLKLGSLTSIR